LQLGQATAAIGHLKTLCTHYLAQEAPPQGFTFLINLATAYQAVDRDPSIESLFEQTLKKWGQYPTPWVARGKILLHQGDKAQAKLHYERALALDPNNAEIIKLKQNTT